MNSLPSSGFSLSGTYLFRLPKDLEKLIVDLLKAPEITITPTKDEDKDNFGIYNPLISIKSSNTINFYIDIPCELNQHDVYYLRKVKAEKIIEKLRTFRENTIDKIDDLQMTCGIALGVKNGYFFINIAPQYNPSA